MLDIDVRHRAGAFTLDAKLACQGPVTALFGPSGAGKTTLLNMLAGLVRPQAGRIVFAGDVWFDSERRIFVKPHARGVGYVFQEGRLFPHLGVRRNLLYGESFAQGRAPVASFDEIVHLLGLEPLLDRRVRHLSGGEQQRVAIGRALLARPRLLLMDEPLAALDAARRAEILPYLERLRARFGAPTVYVSHARDEVERLADELALVEGGRARELRRIAR